MIFFLMNLSVFFGWLLDTSLMASMLVVFIIILKHVFKNKLSSKVHYIVWFLILFRLILPFIPQSPFSIYNLFSLEKNNGIVEKMINLDNSNFITTEKIKTTTFNIPGDIIGGTKEIDIPYYTESSILIYNLSFRIWLLGLLIFGIYLLVVSGYFHLKINKSNIIKEDTIMRKILEECKNTVGMYKPIDVYQNSYIKSPVVIGIVHPKILLPKDIMNHINTDDLKYIFMHELVHVKRKDLIISRIMGVLMLFHWFNPLIMYAFRRIRLDREISCDSMVLSYLNEKEIEGYGRTLIKLAARFLNNKEIPEIAGILNSKSQIKRRIIMIKSYEKSKRKWSVVGIAMIFMLSMVFLTNANAYSRLLKPGRIVDKIDYSFVNDNNVKGSWKYVDFVKEVKDFTPGKKSWKGGDYLSYLKFYDKGKMGISINNESIKEVTYMKWTKGIVVHYGDKTASHYSIVSMNGSEYMFFEWKSGDYVFRHMKPYYYVLKKIK